MNLKIQSHKDFYISYNYLIIPYVCPLLLPLLDFLLAHMPNPENIGEAERRAQYDAHLSQLKHWK